MSKSLSYLQKTGDQWHLITNDGTVITPVNRELSNIYGSFFVACSDGNIHSVPEEFKISEAIIDGCHEKYLYMGTDPGNVIQIRRELLDLKDKYAALENALAMVVDATEDKGGQFRAWHNHLRDTTKHAKSLLTPQS